MDLFANTPPKPARWQSKVVEYRNNESLVKAHMIIHGMSGMGEPRYSRCAAAVTETSQPENLFSKLGQENIDRAADSPPTAVTVNVAPPRATI